MWTDRQVKAMKPVARPYRVPEDTNKRGAGRLVIEVKPNGAKYFYFRYYFGKYTDGERKGKPRLKYVSIGRFRESAKATGFTLAEARGKALNYGELIKQGLDVKTFIEEEQLEEEKRVRQFELAKQKGTLDQLIKSYLSAMEARGKRSHESVRHSLNIYLYQPFPEMVKRKANAIETDDIYMIIKRMINGGVTTHSNRIRSYLHAAFNYGIHSDNDPFDHEKAGGRDKIKFNLKINPVTPIPMQAAFERVGEHVITEDEIKVIWNELPNESQITSWAVKLALTTGQRSGEILKLKWADIDFNDQLMTIPSSVSKNKIEHVVPLNDLAWAVIEEMKEITGSYEYLFPTSYRGVFKEGKHISGNTIAKIVREYCDGHEKVKKFIPRDIRRTFKTLAGKAGIDKAIRDRLQNHALQDVSSKHYDRYDYLPEKRQALKVWNDYLELIIHPDKKVTRLADKRA